MARTPDKQARKVASYIPWVPWDEVAADLTAFNTLYAKAVKLKSASPEDPAAKALLNQLAYRSSGSPTPALDPESPFRQWSYKALDRTGRKKISHLWFEFNKAVGKAQMRGSLSGVVFHLNLYRNAVNDVLQKNPPAPKRFSYSKLTVLNPDGLPDKVARTLLDGLDYVIGLFKRRGVEALFYESVKVIRLFSDYAPSNQGPATGHYNTAAKRIGLSAVALEQMKGGGRFLKSWVHEIFLHELGHHLHLSILPTTAKAEWDAGWAGVEDAKQELEAKVDTLRAVEHADRVKFVKLLEGSGWDPKKAGRKVKGIERLRFLAWLYQPNPLYPTSLTTTPSQVRLNATGTRLFDFLRDPEGSIQRDYTESDYDWMGPEGLEDFRQEKLQETHQMVQRNLGIDSESASYAGPYLDPGTVEEVVSQDKTVEKAIDAIQVPGEYARTNEKEDFAETFVAFMAAPGKLSDQAKYRMQRTLSLAGLYGKPIMRLAAEVQVHKYTRLVEQGVQKVHFFHLERDGVHYLAHVKSGSGLDYGLDVQGSRSQILKQFDLAVQGVQRGVGMYTSGAEIETEQMDAQGQKGLDLLTHPKWGPDWGGKTEEAPEGDAEQQDFHRLLVKQVKDWKGSANSLRVMNHSYWPTFHSMVQKAVKRKYGSKIKAYRGIYGRQALDIIQGKPLKLHRVSSWAAELKGALAYRGSLGKDFWVIIGASFKPSDIVMAPVTLPDYAPDPDVLRLFATDVQHSGDELVVQSKGTVPFKIVRRTRKKIQANLAVQDRVREVTADLSQAAADAYMQALEQPDTVLDNQALGVEFGPHVASIARRLLLSDPALAADGRKLTSKVRQELQGGRTASQYFEYAEYKDIRPSAGGDENGGDEKAGKSYELEIGDPVFTGKYLNSPGRIEGFGESEKGDPTVVVRKPPKGDKGKGSKKEVKVFKLRYDEAQAKRDEEKKKQAVDRLAGRFLKQAVKTAGLADTLKQKIQVLIRDYQKALDAGRASYQELKAIGELFADWFTNTFRVTIRTTPRGGKKVKAEAEKFLWVAKNAVHMRKDHASGLVELQSRWKEFQPWVPELVRLFSDEGGTSIVKEINTSIATYINDRGVSTPNFKKYVKALDAVFGSVKGWRRKALAAGFKVSLSGPDKFRGTSAGRYNAESDTMFVRATPKVMKRSGGTYGAPDYILIHELGHRYEHKIGVGVDFGQSQWATTRYSRARSGMGSSEGFAELFALGHFGIRKVRSEFGDVADRFEQLMSTGGRAAKAWTPQRIHTLADDLGIPWDDDPDFMAFSKGVTGKGHLDDMTAVELGKLAQALKGKTPSKTAGDGQVYRRDEPVMIGPMTGGPEYGPAVVRGTPEKRETLDDHVYIEYPDGKKELVDPDSILSRDEWNESNWSYRGGEPPGEFGKPSPPKKTAGTSGVEPWYSDQSAEMEAEVFSKLDKDPAFDQLRAEFRAISGDDRLGKTWQWVGTVYMVADALNGVPMDIARAALRFLQHLPEDPGYERYRDDWKNPLEFVEAIGLYQRDLVSAIRSVGRDGKVRLYKTDIKTLRRLERKDAELERMGSWPPPWVLALRIASKYQKKKEVPKAEGKGTTTVYEYSEGQVQHRDREKAKKVEKIRGSIGKLRTKYRGDLTAADEKVRYTALAIGLMDVTYERVGNDESAKEGHFGVTGWQAKHVKLSGGKATISYTGKSGVKHVKEVTDKSVVSAIKSAMKGKSGTDSLCSGEDCDIDASDVNDYLKPFGISAKDVRGYHANTEVQKRLKGIRSKGGELPTDREERTEKLKAEFDEALEEAAEAVGHEASTLRSQYLVPGLEDAYLKDGTVTENFAKQGGSLDYLYWSTKFQRMASEREAVFRGPLRKFIQKADEAIAVFGWGQSNVEGTQDPADDLGGGVLGYVFRRGRQWFSMKLDQMTPTPRRNEMAAVNGVRFNYRGAQERLVRRVIASAVRVATKTPGQKEDEEVRRLQRGAPKKKPPRKDLRRERMKVEDDDIEGMGADGQKDLSKNYKKTALRVADRWVRHLIADAAGGAPAPAGGGGGGGGGGAGGGGAGGGGGGGEKKHKPGDSWQADSGVWVGMNPKGTTHTFSKDDKGKEQAKAFAKGMAEEGEDTEKAVDDAKKKEKRQKLKAERDAFRDKATSIIEDMDLPDEAKAGLDEMLTGKGKDELFRSFRAAEKEMRARLEDGITAEMMKDAVKDPFKGVDTSDPTAMAEAMVEAQVRDKVLLDPSNVGGKSLSSSPLDNKALTERGVAAFNQFKHVSPKMRQEIANKAATQLAVLDPESPEAVELNKVVDGLQLAAAIHGENLETTTVSGEKDEKGAAKTSLLREPMSEKHKMLAKTMANQGNAALLLTPDTGQAFSSEGRAAVRDALGQLDDAEMGELSKGAPWESMSKLVGPTSALGGDVQEFLRAFMRDMAVSDMVTVQGIAAAHSRKMKADPDKPSEVYDSLAEEIREAAGEEIEAEVDSWIQCLHDAGSDPDAKAKCMANADGVKVTQMKATLGAADAAAEKAGITPDPQDEAIAVARHIAEGGDPAIADQKLEKEPKKPGEEPSRQAPGDEAAEKARAEDAAEAKAKAESKGEVPPEVIKKEIHELAEGWREMGEDEQDEQIDHLVEKLLEGTKERDQQREERKAPVDDLPDDTQALLDALEAELDGTAGLDELFAEIEAELGGTESGKELAKDLAKMRGDKTKDTQKKIEQVKTPEDTEEKVEKTVEPSRMDRLMEVFVRGPAMKKLEDIRGDAAFGDDEGKRLQKKWEDDPDGFTPEEDDEWVRRYEEVDDKFENWLADSRGRDEFKKQVSRFDELEKKKDMSDAEFDEFMGLHDEMEGVTSEFEKFLKSDQAKKDETTGSPEETDWEKFDWENATKEEKDNARKQLKTQRGKKRDEKEKKEKKEERDNTRNKALNLVKQKADDKKPGEVWKTKFYGTMAAKNPEGEIRVWLKDDPGAKEKAEAFAKGGKG